MYYLLDIASDVAKLSDLITEKWAEVLGWIAIPTVSVTLICCLFKIITAIINKKISKKSIKPLSDKVVEAKEAFLNTAEEIKQTFSNNINEYSCIIENKVANAIKNYEEEKRKIYNEIMKSNLELKNAIGDVLEIPKDVVEAPKIEETKLIEEPKIEEEIKEEQPPTEIIETDTDVFAR